MYPAVVILPPSPLGGPDVSPSIHVAGTPRAPSIRLAIATALRGSFMLASHAATVAGLTAMSAANSARPSLASLRTLRTRSPQVHSGTTPDGCVLMPS